MEDLGKIDNAIELAAEIPDGELAAWIANYCGDDEALRSELESLLSYRSRSVDFLEVSAAAYAAGLLAVEQPDHTGRRFGRYTIIREIGSGGMGAVFLAERSDGEFAHKVAIKIVRQTIAETEMVERFRKERQILASLNHPNIARLLDGGLSDSGEPFLVMEYIEGRPLTEYAGAAKLSLNARLSLFLKICAAVSFAHQNLIIHRDIKPSNILVDESGEPKLLDFGLAKVFDEALSDTDRSQTAFTALTPAYASPEQLRGLNVTTATDIYSLGVVLYELLTGQRPHDLRSRSYDDILRIVSTREPVRPSSAVTHLMQVDGNGRGAVDQREISTRLRGDLDSIVLMALRREPERRYRSADQFAEDIERFLKDLPILARDDTFAYRASKFVRRNSVGVLAGSMVMIATIAGAVVSRKQARRAERERARAQRRFDDVRQLTHSLMFEIHDSVQNLPGATETRQLLVSRARGYLDSLANEVTDDASLLRDLAVAYRKVGDIQGNPYSANLGDIEGAMQMYRRSLEITEKLIDTGPKDLEMLRDLATLYDRMGEIRLHSSDTKGGLVEFHKSLDARRHVLGQNADDPAAQREFAVSMMKVGEALQKLGDVVQALDLERQALAVFERLAFNNAEDLAIKRDVLLAMSKIGYMLFIADDLDGAKDVYQRAFDHARSLAVARSDDAVAMRDLSICYNNIGRVLLKMGHPETAEENYRRSLSIAERLAESDPRNELARSDVAYVLARLGSAQVAAGKFESALNYLRSALNINTALYEANPKHAFTLAEIGDCHQAMGEAFEGMGSLTDALISYGYAIEARERMSSYDKADAEYLGSLAESYQAFSKINITLAELSSDDHRTREYWEQARLSSAKNSLVWIDLNSRGTLTKTDQKKAKENLELHRRSSAAVYGLSRS